MQTLFQPRIIEMLRRILIFHPSTPTQKELDDYKMAVANQYCRVFFLRYHSCFDVEYLRSIPKREQDMPSTTKHTWKPPLTRKILEDENLFFDGYVYKKKDLPTWLQPIRHEMKYVHTKIPELTRDMFEHEIEEFECSGYDAEAALMPGWSLKPRHYHSRKGFRTETSVAESETLKVLNDCCRVKNMAIEMRRVKATEAHWVSFLRAEFFKTYTEVHDTEDKHRHVSL